MMLLTSQNPSSILMMINRGRPPILAPNGVRILSVPVHIIPAPYKFLPPILLDNQPKMCWFEQGLSNFI